MVNTEELIRKQSKQIERLKEKLSKRDAYVVRLKEQIEKLKLSVNSSDGLVEQKKPANEVRNFIVEHRDIWNELKELCSEWNLRSRNMKYTIKEIRNIFEPDEFGLVHNSERDVLNYIIILRKLGKNGYYRLDPSIEKCYKPYDASILFKHFTAISGMILKRQNPEKYEQDKKGYVVGVATLNGVKIGGETVKCTWEDLKTQMKGFEHRNDSVELEKFSGDDKIREIYRRRVQKYGHLDLDAVQKQIIYAYNERFKSKDGYDKIILESTPIKDELDEDLELDNFKEVK